MALNLPEKPTAQPTAPDAVRSDTANSGKHRVLLIEDDMALADQITSLLESAGYNVEVATDGNYGLMLAENFHPELILMDAELSGMSSSGLTQVLRNAPPYAALFRSTRILYLSEHRGLLQQRFDKLPDTPIADYIFKPFDPAELLEKVERVFGVDAV